MKRFLGIEVVSEVSESLAASAAHAAERMGDSRDALLDVLATFGDLVIAHKSSGVDKDLKPSFYGRWIYGPDYVIPEASGDTAKDRNRLNRSATYAFQAGALLSEGLAFPACVVASIDSEWKRCGIFSSCFLKASKVFGMEASERRSWLKSFAAIPAGSDSAKAVYTLLAAKDSVSANAWAKAFCPSVLPPAERRPKGAAAWFGDLLVLGSDPERVDSVVEFFESSDDLTADDLLVVEETLFRLGEAAAANRARIVEPV